MKHWLTPAERRAVQAEAKRHGIATEDSEQTIKQALEAVMLGEADEVAYAVTEAGGIEWVTPHIWARTEGKPMKVKTAREIIAQALEDDTTDLTEQPEDDAAALKAAEELVMMARSAWEGNIRGEEVKHIIDIADAADEDGGKAKPSAKPKPSAAPKAAAKGRPSRSKEPEAEADPRTQEAPWDGYDNDEVNDIIEGVEVWVEGGETDDVVHVYLYEQAHDNRKRIIERIEELLPELTSQTDGESDPEPAPEETPSGPDPHKVPFDGYDELKLPEVKASLEDYLGNEDVDDSDKLEVLEHVFAYEAVHKTRTTLMDYLDEKIQVYKEGADGNAAGAEAEEGQGEGSAAHEADAGAAGSDQGGKEDGKKSRSATGARAKSARPSSNGEASDASFVIAYASSSSTVSISCDGKHAAAGFLLDLLDRGVTSVTVTRD